MLSIFLLLKVSSYPSILYETIPLVGAKMYSALEFSSVSYEFLSVINFFMCEPAGLNSPTIFAFFLQLNHLFLFLMNLLLNIYLCYIQYKSFSFVFDFLIM